ncbi:MAG: helix-hairpin-helix domain-containing protein [Candidatus Zixiibacteriota bacterium]
MNRFFEFTKPQLGVIGFLVVLLILVSTYRFIRGYAKVDETSLKFTVAIGDNDTRYQPPFIVDLNLSPADSLELLPGIGPVLAERIVAFRDSSRFEKASDILKVKGIGYDRYEKLQPYIEVKTW